MKSNSINYMVNSFEHPPLDNKLLSVDAWEEHFATI